MKSHRLVFAALSIALVACTPRQAPSEAVPQPQAPAAAAPAPDAPAPDAAAAKRAPGQENAAPLQVFRAFGTEPFWNVNVEDATLTYTTPMDREGMTLQGERRAVAGGVEITGNHEGKAFALTVSEGVCSDGMSDNQYALVSTFRYGDAEYKGCAEAAK